MTEWKSLTADEQTAALQQVAGIKHLPPQAVEKDLWVTIILRIVFTLPFADKAIQDDSLWENIHHHRQVFTSMVGVDYTPDIRRRIVLVPPEDLQREWRADYEAMRGTMIFGLSPSFDELLVKLHRLQDRFRRG